MGSLPDDEKYSPSSHHLRILEEIVEGSSVESSLIRSYGRSFNGFAAKLTTQERQKLAAMKDVVSIFPSRTLQPQTTRSWNFMGFKDTIKRDVTAESDVIVGVIDTGIWPESDSFSDKGFGTTPKKWNGICRGGNNFTCNNKVIGARYYSGDVSSARDDIGHGSHTASIVAGNEVNDASFYGLAKGVARGGVPSSRISVYKVCFSIRCSESAILAAFDDAIADGVDIISISIGGNRASKFATDSIAIGSFHAMEKGIFTSQSAGNSGAQGSVSSVAPWLISVAASSTDRKFVDKIVLGDGQTLIGRSINSFTLKGKKFPLVYGKDVSESCPESSAQACIEDCVDRSLVKGKIVICDEFEGGEVTFKAGALGSVLISDKLPDVSSIVPFSASVLIQDLNSKLKTYLNSTINPRAEILKTEAIQDSAAPVVASFSSRGPNAIVPDILKPDITAPGINILAAYSPLVPPNPQVRDDPRRVPYNILSGTSMASPHVAGTAAYIKSLHPDWSPSAIQSAIITTAWSMNSSNTKNGEFAYGSGHLNPVNAANPGLVYEAYKEDYIKFLCSIGSPVGTITANTSSCKGVEKVAPKDLNYPSMAAQLNASKPFRITFNRTVTNVGLKISKYEANVLTNPKLKVEVVPSVLSFKSLKEKLSFVVTVTGSGFADESVLSASLVWSDGTYSVRSPIVVYTIGT